MYSSARRTSAAISSGDSIDSVRWLMKPTATFFSSLPLYGSKSASGYVSGVLRLDRPHVRVQPVEEDVDRVLVRDARVEAVLRAGVAPARVHPDLDVVETLDVAG